MYRIQMAKGTVHHNPSIGMQSDFVICSVCIGSMRMCGYKPPLQIELYINIPFGDSNVRHCSLVLLLHVGKVRICREVHGVIRYTFYIDNMHTEHIGNKNCNQWVRGSLNNIHSETTLKSNSPRRPSAGCCRPSKCPRNPWRKSSGTRKRGGPPCPVLATQWATHPHIPCRRYYLCNRSPYTVIQAVPRCWRHMQSI